MKKSWRTGAVFVVLYLPVVADAQTAVGALAINERQGGQYGWAVDFDSTATARGSALGECGAGCSVVLTFERCGAYAADPASGSRAYGWGESYASADDARERALSECRTRGGTGCVVRAWGCNGPVVEEGLALDRGARRQIQLGLRAGGYDPGGADGMFGPRTRAAIRSWQRSRGARATGYLDGAAAQALRTGGASGPAAAQVARPGPSAANAAVQASPAGAEASSPASPELEGLFWQSIMNSPNPAEFEAYLAQFPNGVFRTLAQARLAALQSPVGASAAPAGPRPGGAGASAVGGRVPAASRPGTGNAAPELGARDARRQPGEVFRDCAECPEMVVMAGGGLALGRYEVTVGEYRAFASATGGGAGADCWTWDRRVGDHHSWRDPRFRQTDRHPVTCVSWNDADEYVSWLSQRAGARYRLPSEQEWERGAAGTTEQGCGSDPDQVSIGTCAVGSYGSNNAGLSDMNGNVSEWTASCAGSCNRRWFGGGSWRSEPEDSRPTVDGHYGTRERDWTVGFRVARTLD